MFVRVWVLIAVGILWVVTVAWCVAITMGRNPLPFPDHGSRIFVAASPEAKDAIVALLERHGVAERFRADTQQVGRSIMWDGTIINHSSPELMRKVGGASAAIGLVADDPARDAEAAARFLRARGFSAQVVRDAEPGMPIAFVLTDALSGSALNFRPHVTRMPQPEVAP